MRSYKIESYVPEDDFYRGKDAHFCRTAYENCFVVDIYNDLRILSARTNDGCVGDSLPHVFSLTAAGTASLLTLLNGGSSFLMIPSSCGTLLAYPAWQHLGLGLIFLLTECVENVEKAYQNAQQYAFSRVLSVETTEENEPLFDLEKRLCMLQVYMERLFGGLRQTNVTAHILMIANLVGCRLHEMSVSRVEVTLDERELERLSAYLFCIFMAMRRCNGRVAAQIDGEPNQNIDFSTYAVQEYGLCIQQSMRERVASTNTFDVATSGDLASFAAHPAFADYKAEETDGSFRLHIPLKQKARLSSVAARGAQNELTLVLVPFIKEKHL